ncbi:MAG: T9SS type A sorting domain-containing protein [Flavobacteriales bacterium]|nr:T9SS type A sorting domain-containing protein [Flavobacteriales bacterium]
MRALVPLLATLSLSSTCTAQATHDARIVQYVGTTYACDGTVTPVMKIINNGTETMIGCVVETWKNGLLDNSFDWQLPLPAAEGQVRTPAFPAVDADTGDELEFRIISVNGVPDEVADGNSYSLDVLPALIAASPVVRLGVTTDDAPEETSWTVRNAEYVEVASGGPYTAANTYHEHWLELDPFSCYLLEVTDAAGNGLNSGFVGVYSADQPVLELMPEPFALHSDGFVTGDAAGLIDPPTVGPLSLFPNPSEGQITLDLPKDFGSNIHVKVIDLSGRTVATLSSSASNGPFVMDLSGLAVGGYHIQASDANGRMAAGFVVRTDR